MTPDRHSVDKRYNIFSETCSSIDSEGQTFSVSDDIVARGFQATAGSGILEGYHPVFDATVVSRMSAAGCLFIGKTNMDEFGMGMFSTTGNGTPRNPFDPERSCGGSSGGAACAASVFDGHVALGTSGSGSISVPAAFCGVFGLTPTHGRVSRYGQIDSVSSMGPIGILASKSELIKRFLPVISGGDDSDPLTATQPALVTGKKKLRSVAVPKGITDDVSDAVRKAFSDSLDILRGMSVDVEFVDIPNLKYAMPAHYIISVTESATGLARYCGMRCGRQDGDLSLPFNDYFTSFRTKYFGREAKLRTIMGTYMTLGDNRNSLYLRALGVRQLILNDHKAVLRTHDAILTPTMPFIAPKFSDIEKMNSAESYMAGRFAVPSVFCGLPSLSVPCGYSDNMPMGIQFISDHWDEDVLLSAAELWERSFEVRTPEVSL
ncbi:MAG: Asp-tRNA(Asn)/Glu-tRNA(Gln) amidotransferase subunit GatA [Methanomassiliicoccaceae archaeon]|jgi:aspartyl-tRNA(Asn)/glutamyl-tRNA(Gln) amidotransferase subunit A|nr:Asp-tRNA(Asn)/Glu-tRNA(Gln) amidotransferase subunit GatA [Methanomassiliicoccaceae archaeon]